jgi:two-component sensor histidine kinase
MAPHPLPDPVVALNLALAVVEASVAPLLLLDKDLMVVAASRSFCATFQIAPAKTQGRQFGQLGGGEWAVPQLSSLLKATAAGFAEVDVYEMDLVRKGRENRRLVLSAKKLHYAESADIRLVLSVVDVTDARQAEKLQVGLLKEKDVLLQELHHRVANSLQIIASVLLQSARKVQSEETRLHLHDAHHRVMSVAALQQQLASSKAQDVQLAPYFAALCESIGASMIRDREQITLSVTADDSVTTADTSISMGLIVTELVINALKHAFPDNRKGTITVDYHSHGPSWNLSVRDDGVGMPSGRTLAKAGLGTNIVQALTMQLGGIVSVSPDKPGTKVSIQHKYVPFVVGQAAPLEAV